MRVFFIGLGSCALAAVYISGLMWMLGYLAGWRALARRFPASFVPQGSVYKWCSLRLWSFGGYNNALRATLVEEGIHLQPMPLFRIGHPPILFPWSVSGPMREAKAFGVSRWVVPLRVDNRTLELALPEAARPFVDKHAMPHGNSLDSPFSSRPAI